MNRQDRNTINTWLAKHAMGTMKLDDFIHETADTFPILGAALEGIYCGRDGRTDCMVTEKLNLAFGWHDNKVEFAYLS